MTSKSILSKQYQQSFIAHMYVCQWIVRINFPQTNDYKTKENLFLITLHYYYNIATRFNYNIHTLIDT